MCNYLLITDLKYLPAFFIHIVRQPNFITRRHVCWKEQGECSAAPERLEFLFFEILGMGWFPPFGTAEMDWRLSRGHFSRLKNGISSVAGIFHGWKALSTQSRNLRCLMWTHFQPRQKSESHERFIEIPTSQYRTPQCGRVYKLHWTLPVPNHLLPNLICFTHYYPIPHGVAPQQSLTVLHIAEQR